VLTGEGADELFGGYRKYRYLKAFNYYYNLTPSKLRKALSISMGVFGNSLPLERLKEFNSSSSVSEYYLQLISFFTKKEKEGLCDSLNVGRQDIKLVKPFFGNREIVDSLMALDFKTWLPDDLLMKVDKTTMAHALEARVPYLDPNVIELSSRIPHNLKIRFNKEKYVLREAMKNKVPAKIYNRKKHGFNVPVHRWLVEELKDISMELLSKDSVRRRGLFNYNYIQKIFKNYNKSKMYYSRQLWTLLNFEIWARIYLDNEDIKNKNIGFDDILG
jgi:asparagine synthase (glutamine-hydrolysing)